MLHPGLKRFLNRKKGSFLVTGPPGTGKTYQLIKLVEYLVTDRNIDPGRIMVFCFNRKWAKILREETARSIGKSIFEIPITTFFAYCCDFIKSTQFPGEDSPEVSPGTIEKTGAPDIGEIKILNAPEQWLLLKSTILNDLDRKIHPITFKHILSKNKNVGISFIQEVFDFILRAQENLLCPGDLMRLFRKDSSPGLAEIIDIYSVYMQVLVREKKYNYGRLLGDTVGLLKSNNSTKKMIQDSYDYILVDDLQEVNKAQYEIVKMISRNNCIFFGNDDQCTYAFRGSMVSIFNDVAKNLIQDFPDDKRALFLDKNYRSGPLLNKINSLFIKKNTLRFDKSSGAGISVASSVTVKEFKNSVDEANALADTLKHLITVRQVRPEDILVLVKGRGYKTRLLENVLENNRILYLQRNSRALLDNPFVMYVLNFLKLLVLLKPFYKNRAELEGINVTRVFECVLFSGFTGIDPVTSIRQNAGKKDIWEKLSTAPLLAEALKDFFEMEGLDAFEISIKVLNDRRIGIFKYLAEKNSFEEHEKNAIMSILGDFLHTVNDFVEKNPGASGVSEYIGYIEDALTNSFLEEIEDSTKELVRPGFINIMSYHQCRGLEFDAVFLPFINKKYLPAEFGNTQLYDMQTFNYFSGGRKIPEDLLRKKHLEDERKLFYNGLTRARRFLFISSSIQEPVSIFFQEIRSICEKEKNEKTVSVNTGKGRKIYYSPRKNWLLRKSMIARTFRYVSGGNLDEKKFNDDLEELLAFYHYDRWWRTKKATRNNHKPFLIFKPAYSYSSLNTFKMCPFRYKMKYYFGIDEEENLAALIGSIYHDVLRSYFGSTGRDYSWPRLKNIIIEIFNTDRYRFDFNYLRNEIIKKSLYDFQRFYENFVKGKAPDVIVEKEFDFMIGSDVIKGRIDQISCLDDARIEMIDFKSGSKNISTADITEDIQLRLYRMAVDCCSSLDFIKGKAITLKYIFIGDEKSKDPVVSIPEDTYDLEKFRKYIGSIIKKTKEEAFDAVPENTYLCSSCGYRLLCPNKDV